jgi:DNA-binding GntR family transcriptional regulator
MVVNSDVRWERVLAVKASQAETTLKLPAFEVSSSLRSKAVDALRAAIITGVMQPGKLYSTPTLASMFGISATPVREAMLSLAKEGLVDAQRNKGYRVIELTDEELDDITETRMLLEVPAIERLARLCDAALAARIERELRHVAHDVVRFAKEGDLISFIEADRRLHLGLLSLIGNTRLVSIVGELRAQSRLYGLQNLVDIGGLEQSANEHEILLDYITRGDAERAAALMFKHIMHVRRTWAGRPEASGPQKPSQVATASADMKPISMLSIASAKEE